MQYLGCECSEAACRGLAGSVGSLRDLALGGQVSSGVGGVPLLAGEGRHRLILPRQNAAPDLCVRLHQLQPTQTAREWCNHQPALCVHRVFSDAMVMLTW